MKRISKTILSAALILSMAATSVIFADTAYGEEQPADPPRDPVAEQPVAEPDNDGRTDKKKDPFKNRKGWVRYKFKKYYIRKGKPLKGVKKVGSTWYEFNKKTGVLKRKIGDGMDKKAQKYKSSRKYLILVSYDRHRVRIYKGRKNKWKRIKNFKCTLGAPSTPTPTGTFTITDRGKYFDTGESLRCWYWTGFIGCLYLFHSVLYDRSFLPVNVIDGRLGKNASHGCIRLKLSNARWIYRKIPQKTKVVIY